MSDIIDDLKTLVERLENLRQDAAAIIKDCEQKPAEPMEPEIVRDVSVLAFGRRQKLLVGRLYILTPEGFDEVDP